MFQIGFKKSPSPPAASAATVANDQPSSSVPSITSKQIQQKNSPTVVSSSSTNTAAVKGTQKSEIPEEEVAEKRTGKENCSLYYKIRWPSSLISF